MISQLGQKVRKAPATSAPVVGGYGPGQQVLIACKAAGERVAGDALWYRLADGRGWMSAHYVRPNGQVPPCRISGPGGQQGSGHGRPGGAKGSKGSKGGPRPSAPQGVPAAGSPVTVVQDHSVPPLSLDQHLRSPACPPGTRIIGGGYFQPGSRIGGLEKLDAYPSVTENVYVVGVNNTSPTAIDLRVFAICQPGAGAKPAPGAKPTPGAKPPVAKPPVTKPAPVMKPPAAKPPVAKPTPPAKPEPSAPVILPAPVTPPAKPAPVGKPTPA
ncbi:hypothetical protein [Streptomyces sp. NPDC008001]|uniref:hypothetical protein n=1 Tax=Streptomyces sp. NPDC008001 TaxID=3364804 RepID=UPI0036EFD25B